MKQALYRLTVSLLTFTAGLWWTGVWNNPWVMAKYHRTDFIESCFVLLASAVCFGLGTASMSSKRHETAGRVGVYNLLMLSLGLLMLLLGLHLFSALLGGGRVIYDSLLD